jgi:hypothetical protein
LSLFCSQAQFETADFLFKKAEMSQGNVDILMELWASTTEDGDAPFQDHQEMLVAIDTIDNGDTPWQTFNASYSGMRPPGDPPDWMLKEFTIFVRDLLTVVWGSSQTLTLRANLTTCHMWSLRMKSSAGQTSCLANWHGSRL